MKQNKHIGLIMIFLSFLICGNSYSQSKKYFDENWEVSSTEDAAFYRITTQENDSLFHVRDYYINGVLQMDGHYSDLDNETLEGKINFYTEQGKITISETYINGELNGLTTAYLNSGKIDYTTDYKNGKIYNGVYNGVVVRRFYKNGVVIKDIEHNPPNQYYILKTTIYGKEIDTVYWRTAKGKKLGSGTYKNYKIIDGLNVVNLLDNTIYTYYKNGLREGVQKLFDASGKLIANMSFKNDELILNENLNPLTNKMIVCTYKDNRPFEGRYFDYKPMYKYYDEFIFENGKLKIKNSYSVDKNGKLKLIE